MNYRSVVPETLREGQRVAIHVLDVGSSGGRSSARKSASPRVGLIVSSHHHHLVLGYLDCCREGEGEQLLGGRVEDGVDQRPLSPLPSHRIDFDLVADGVILHDAAELVDVAAIEGAAGEGASFIVHGLDLLNFVVEDVVTLAPVGDDLVVEEAAQNIDILAVEADGVRRPAVLHAGAVGECVVLKIVLVDLLGFEAVGGDAAAQCR